MRLQRQIDLGYQRAFTNLVISVTEMDSALQKCLYATSPSMVSSVCTEAFGKSMAAQASLSELPFSDIQLEQTSSFISRVGDYAFLLSRSAAQSQQINEEQLQALTSLSQAASLLADNLIQLQADVNAGLLTVQALQAADEAVGSLRDSFQQIETEFPEVPSLIYDGPFSDHMLQQKPKALEGLSAVSQAQALEAAAEWTGLKSSAFEFAGESGGNLPCYYFLAAADGGELSLCISKQGGKVLSMFNSRQISTVNLSAEQMLENARLYLREQGFENMRESYWVVEENIGIVNFAYVQEDVVCYPDLIKVHVDMDSGRIIGFEAQGYYMNHVQRSFALAELTMQEARNTVPSNLSVLSEGCALIPSSGNYELYCYEFKCENADGRHYILYINAVCGIQEKILILIENENGTLTL